MSSHRLDAGAEPRAAGGILFRLLDPLFGFFVWAGHLLTVYIAAAFACVLGLGSAERARQIGFVAVLAIMTGLATALVIIHALRRHRRRETADAGFLVAIAIGNDAVATLGILLQLYPLLLLSACR